MTRVGLSFTASSTTTASTSPAVASASVGAPTSTSCRAAKTAPSSFSDRRRCEEVAYTAVIRQSESSTACCSFLTAVAAAAGSRCRRRKYVLVGHGAAHVRRAPQVEHAGAITGSGGGAIYVPALAATRATSIS